MRVNIPTMQQIPPACGHGCVTVHPNALTGKHLVHVHRKKSVSLSNRSTDVGMSTIRLPLSARFAERVAFPRIYAVMCPHVLIGSRRRVNIVPMDLRFNVH